MKKKKAMKILAACAACAACAVLALGLAGCATTNHLDGFDFRGTALRADMAAPPAPQVLVRYEVILDRRDIVYSAFNVISNVAKATQAEKARESMEAALEDVDVPSLVLEEALSSCAAALGARPAEMAETADARLVIDIHDWGIEAGTPLSVVALRMRLTASLYEEHGTTLLWRRDLTVHDNASPVMFGLPPIVGNMVTATALAGLSVDELQEGFTELGRSAARSVARVLQEDLAAARFGG
jgi:hypothetical protein